MCGEHFRTYAAEDYTEGSSPRVRGTPLTHMGTGR